MGGALAQVHQRAADLGAGLPEAWSELHLAAEVFAGDPALVAAVERLIDRLDAQPRDPACSGVTHGDFELDNLAWADHAPTSFDFDEAARGWYVADIANAVRDLAPNGVPSQEHKPRFEAFIAGYRQRTDNGDGPDELATLRAKLGRAMADMRQAVVRDT